MFTLLFLPSAIALWYVAYLLYITVNCTTRFVKDQGRFWTACLADALGYAEPMDVKDVRFVVPARLPHNVVEVSVLREFQQTVGRGNRHQQIVLPENIWNPLLTQSNKQVFQQSLTMGGSDAAAPRANSHDRPTPLYVMVEFETLRRKPGARLWGWKLPERARFCCFYRLQGMTDPFLFPPYPLVASRKHAIRPIQRASLLLQHMVDGRLRRQYSCDVTPKINLLSGPRNDFFAHSSVDISWNRRLSFYCCARRWRISWIAHESRWSLSAWET